MHETNQVAQLVERASGNKSACSDAPTELAKLRCGETPVAATGHGHDRRRQRSQSKYCRRGVGDGLVNGRAQSSRVYDVVTRRHERGTHRRIPDVGPVRCGLLAMIGIMVVHPKVPRAAGHPRDVPHLW